MQYTKRAVYHVMGYRTCVAKGGAETLKFNMTLTLLPVCRNTITGLRNKNKLGVVVPFDDNLNFHKKRGSNQPHQWRYNHSDPIQQGFAHKVNSYWYCNRSMCFSLRILVMLLKHYIMDVGL